jgi:putative ABC transport system permease protein
MLWIAYQMLTGNRAKYYSIIFGISFACMLMTQQMSIFTGLMRNTSSSIRDIAGADVWVMDPSVQFIDDITPLSDNDLYRVRGVQGVRWTVPLYKGMAQAQFRAGNFKQFSLIGLDDQTFVGAPLHMLVGTLADLRRPDAIILDESGFRYLFPGKALEEAPNIEFEMNDRRAVLVGVCKASPTFQTYPIAYTRYSEAVTWSPQYRRQLSFVLAQGEPGVPPKEVCARITKETGLMALTRDEFADMTMVYFMRRTGIPVNFGITVLLGFIIGAAIAGQTFYLFTIDNLKQYGCLKAMGVTNWTILRMVVFQGLVVGVFGYCFGLGMAAGAENLMRMKMESVGLPPAQYMAWQLPLLTAVAASLIVMGSSLLSLRRVLTLEPASVFR